MRCLLYVMMLTSLSLGSISLADSAADTSAGDGLPPVWFDQNLGDQVPLDVLLQDEQGRDVLLGDLFGDRPVVLALVYYRCPMLCTMILNGLVESLSDVRLDAGPDFTVIAVSIDPRETPELAASKQAAYVKRYGRDNSDRGWRMLTAHRQSEVQRLADAVGYGYSYDPRSGQYAHPSGVVLLTAGGVISQYFMGVDYPSRSMRLGLVQASQGSIGSPVDQLLLRCFQFDPLTGNYSLAIINVLRGAGALTLLLLGTMLFCMIRLERRRRTQLPSD